MARFGIAVAHVVQRGALDGSRRPRVEFRHDPRLGEADSAQAAKAAFWRLMDPDLAAAPDAFVAMHFDRQARNGGAYRAVRLPARP